MQDKQADAAKVEDWKSEPGGIRGGRRFVILIWLAQAGCLLEARSDFSFQIESILFLFLVFAPYFFSMSRRSGASRH
jgi:hypothetical protein